MWRHKLAWSLVFLLVFSPAVLSDSADIPTVVGTAYDRDSGRLLYTERHFCSDEGRICTVQYRDNSGGMIAQKTLDYRAGRFSPAMTMTDYRLGIELSLPTSEQENIVVDAGFDNYVRSVWEQLARGESVHFPLLLADFDEPINMRADLKTSGDCHPAELCLEVSLDSWLLSKLTSPIALSYSRENRKLLYFGGISNIRGEDGESLSVDIHYRYENDVSFPGSTPTAVVQF